jgi:hypothetical protein
VLAARLRVAFGVNCHTIEPDEVWLIFSASHCRDWLWFAYAESYSLMLAGDTIIFGCAVKYPGIVTTTLLAPTPASNLDNAL